MRDLDHLYVEVNMRAGTDIPSLGIPQIIDLANRLGCCVQCKANDVTVIAHPGDDAIDLAVAWEVESKGNKPSKIAVAYRGRQIRLAKIVAPQTESA